MLGRGWWRAGPRERRRERPKSDLDLWRSGCRWSFPCRTKLILAQGAGGAGTGCRQQIHQRKTPLAQRPHVVQCVSQVGASAVDARMLAPMRIKAESRQLDVGQTGLTVSRACRRVVWSGVRLDAVCNAEKWMLVRDGSFVSFGAADTDRLQSTRGTQPIYRLRALGADNGDATMQRLELGLVSMLPSR